MKLVNDGKPKKIITLSLDDCVLQDERFIGLLKKFDMTCTFNVNSGLFGTKEMIGPPEKRVPHDRITLEQARHLYDGYEVAGHTLTHPDLDTLSREEIIHEIEDDRRQLEEITGQKLYGIGFPGMNRFNDMVLDVVKTCTPYIYARTAEFTYDFRMPTVESLMRWAPTCFFVELEKDTRLTDAFEAAVPEDDMLFFIVGHTYEFDICENWEWLEGYLQRLANMKDTIITTSADVALYVRSKANV